MKRVILLIALLTAAAWLSSCESRRFQFVATLNKTVDFDVDHSGALKPYARSRPHRSAIT